MKTFKFSLVLRTRQNTDVFITLDDNIYGIHSKRVNILYILLCLLQNAEFVWSKTFQSLLLSVYYVGCFISQVPGGWLAHRFGGKRLVTVTMLMSALLTLLTPVLIRANAYIVLAVRLIMGICSVSGIPSEYMTFI